MGTALEIGTGHGLGAIDMSADGGFVAFVAAGLPVEPEPCCFGVYVYDREQNSYELVSVASGDFPGGGFIDGWYDNVSISADGRFVTFSSWAGDEQPDKRGLFVRDRLLGTTARISARYEAVASISADGRYVALNGVFVHDRDTDEDGVYDEPEAGESVKVADGRWPAISGDGRFLAYYALDSVILHDRQTGDETTVAQVQFGGAAMDLSGDGRFLAFATNLPQVPEDTNLVTDVYLYDRLSGTLELLSLARDGSLGNAASAWGFPKESLAVIALTADGAYAAFHSWATNLVPGEGAGVFVAGTSVLGAVDSDRDGCSDKQELGPDERLGGRRNAENFWDFFDVPDQSNARDKVVSASDISRVVERFGTTGDPGIDPLSPPDPAPAYHPAFDRLPAEAGGDLWDLRAADGTMGAGDIAAVVFQFGHSCSAS